MRVGARILQPRQSARVAASRWKLRCPLPRLGPRPRRPLRRSPARSAGTLSRQAAGFAGIAGRRSPQLLLRHPPLRLPPSPRLCLPRPNPSPRLPPWEADRRAINRRPLPPPKSPLITRRLPPSPRLCTLSFRRHLCRLRPAPRPLLHWAALSFSPACAPHALKLMSRKSARMAPQGGRFE